MRFAFWIGAAMIGVGAAALAKTATLATRALMAVQHHWPWAPFLIAPTGLGVSLWLTRRFFPGSQGSGIPQVIAAMHESRPDTSRLVSLRIALGKIFLTGLSLFSGASIGREGPTVHIGASFAAVAGRLSGIRDHHVLERTLVMAGGAAGIAAAFNTPIAGFMFAIEELARGFEENDTGMLIVTLLISGLTATAIEGNYTYFGIVHTALTGRQWVLIPACGLVGGAMGGLFSRLLLDISARLQMQTRARPYGIVIGLGLVIAALGTLAHGTTYGTGYSEAHALVQNTLRYPWWFPAARWLGNLASYLCGVPGGLFAPALATGAGIGADLGRLFPYGPLPAAVILGMTGYLSGVVQTPLTSFIIVAEMTGNRDMLVPLIATSFLAYLVSRLLCREPVYQALAVRLLRSVPRPP